EGIVIVGQPGLIAPGQAEVVLADVGVGVRGFGDGFAGDERAGGEGEGLGFGAVAPVDVEEEGIAGVGLGDDAGERGGRAAGDGDAGGEVVVIGADGELVGVTAGLNVDLQALVDVAIEIDRDRVVGADDADAVVVAGVDVEDEAGLVVGGEGVLDGVGAAVGS